MLTHEATIKSDREIKNRSSTYIIKIKDHLNEFSKLVLNMVERGLNILG